MMVLLEDLPQYENRVDQPFKLQLNEGPATIFEGIHLLKSLQVWKVS